MIVSRLVTYGWTVYGLRQFTQFVKPDEFLLDPLDPLRSDWSNRSPWVDENSRRLVFEIGAFLLCGPRINILIDAGIGNDKVRARDVFNGRQDDWYSDFSTLGLSTTDIHTVLFTHLHVDHVGYATRLVDGEIRPAFPNARYVTSEVEYTYWTSGEARPRLNATGDYMADSISPLVVAGVLDLVEPGRELFPGVRRVAVPGHTPGSVTVNLSARNADILFIGDAIHHPILVAHPTMRTRYCWRPDDAAVARANLISECMTSDAIVYPAHFAGMRPGRFRAIRGQVHFQPLAQTEFQLEPSSSNLAGAT